MDEVGTGLVECLDDASDDVLLLIVECGGSFIAWVFEEVEDAGGSDDFFFRFDEDARIAEFVDGGDGAEMDGVFEFGLFEGEDCGVEFEDQIESIASGGGELWKRVLERVCQGEDLDGSFAGLLFDGIGDGGGHDEP